jgi:hypothetical protein
MKDVKKIVSNTYFKLFIKREGKVVLGHHLSNLWLLIGVLTATFMAIAFSNASMDYLDEKMNDPFIKWVDIKNDYGEGNFTGLEIALNDYENQSHYLYDSYQSDYYFSYMFFGKEDRVQYFKCRFFQDLNTPLVEAILADDNVVDGCRIGSLEDLSEHTIGVIITDDALNKLGYEKAPAFLNIFRYSNDADTLGFKLYQGSFAKVPVPVLGVVKRLPSNVDIISSKYLYEQDNNDDTYPLHLNNLSYASSLHYFIPADVDYDEASATLKNITEENSSVEAEIDEYSFYKPELQSYVEGRYLSLLGSYSSMVPVEVQAIDDEFMTRYGDAHGIFRVYDYDFSNYSISEKSYLSVYFNSLDSIRVFENYVKESFQVKIDMSQINAKENFNEVSIMAGILSWAIIVFAIVCIILFVVNLFQSYFQKVKRNLGTFKAFGMSNTELISVYMLIMAATIISAILAALFITFSIQEVLILLHVLKDGAYTYLSLWSFKTFCSIVIIICASVYTVYAVMNRLLKATPGDLIYDRQ